ncbi:MAG: DUF1444 family protein [Bacillota bacterium]
MSKGIVTPEEFRRIVAERLRQERPDVRVQMLGQNYLMLWEKGRRRVHSLGPFYRQYRQTPERQEALIAMFLRTVTRERRRQPSLLEVRERILPQLLPASLIDETHRARRELAALHYVGDLAVAFVIDEEDRYTYIHRQLMERWGVKETDLLALAIRNLQLISRDAPPPFRFGRGKRLLLAWEVFDGYDASRVLLTRSLNEMAAHVDGNPIIAVPHRDYMVMFGDSDPAFVEEMMERIRDESNNHRYPISTRLYTLHFGTLAVYDWTRRWERVVN